MFIFGVFFILVSLDSTCTAFYENYQSTPEWPSIGFESVSNDEYINGGLNAVARIQIGKKICTGALISDRHVMTSRSCMQSHIHGPKSIDLSVYFVHNESDMSTAIEGKTKFTNVSKLCR